MVGAIPLWLPLLRFGAGTPVTAPTKNLRFDDY
jgi:hypothetical protein